MSNIDLIVSKDTVRPTDKELYGESDRDQYFKANTGAIGATFSHTFDQNTYTRFAIAQTANDVIAKHEFAFRDPAKGKSIAIAQIGLGADVIFHASGSTGHGVFEASRAAGVRAIGVDADQWDDANVDGSVKRATSGTNERDIRGNGKF